jgi:hypothetical protein
MKVNSTSLCESERRFAASWIELQLQYFLNRNGISFTEICFCLMDGACIPLVTNTQFPFHCIEWCSYHVINGVVMLVSSEWNALGKYYQNEKIRVMESLIL